MAERVTRVSVQVLANEPSADRVTRVSVQVLADELTPPDPPPGPTGRVIRSPRYGLTRVASR